MLPIRPLLFAVAASFALSACATPAEPAVAAKPPPPESAPVDPPRQPEPAPGEPAMECDASNTGWAVGKDADATLVERIKSETGSSRARVLKPGQMVTMEFRADRVNIDVDNNNRVLKVRCG
jgi:hypothetical protein